MTAMTLINTRIEPESKRDTGEIFREFSMLTTTAFTAFPGVMTNEPN